MIVITFLIIYVMIIMVMNIEYDQYYNILDQICDSDKDYSI